MTADRRLAKLEGALSPKAATLLWLAEAHQFDSLPAYVDWLIDQPTSAAPLYRVPEAAEAGVRAALANLVYDRKTGRTIEEDRLAGVRLLLDGAFEEFRDYRKNGSWRWAESWSGKSVRELADESGEPIRRNQYKLLFSAWSDQTHASPGVLLETMFSDDTDAEEMIAADDVRIAETLASAVTMFLDLWARLPSIPRPEPTNVTRWYVHFLDEAKKYGGVVTGGKAPPLG
jgi:hypothetical protein